MNGRRPTLSIVQRRFPPRAASARRREPSLSFILYSCSCTAKSHLLLRLRIALSLHSPPHRRSEEKNSPLARIYAERLVAGLIRHAQLFDTPFLPFYFICNYFSSFFALRPLSRLAFLNFYPAGLFGDREKKKNFDSLSSRKKAPLCLTRAGTSCFPITLVVAGFELSHEHTTLDGVIDSLSKKCLKKTY